MTSRIVPALLTDNKEDLYNMLMLCRRFCPFVQIDIMDGIFVPSCGIRASDLESIGNIMANELHLMVRDPSVWIEAAQKAGSRRIIFHIEAVENAAGMIGLVKKAGLEAGLAVNPGTDLAQLIPYVPKVDAVLFMSVEPGFYGAPFIPAVLDKIKRFRRLFPYKETGIDGGVKRENLKAVLDSGVDYVCVGSAIMKSPSPADSFAVLNREAESYRE